MIKPDVDTLKNTLSRIKNKRDNILVILDNIKSSLFEGFYFHHKYKSLETEESIAERTKLRRQRSDEITKKEKKISSKLFGRYFGYSSPSDMYKALNETKHSEENKAEVNTIENKLVNLIVALKSSPPSDVKKIKNRNNMLEIVERILYFNQQNQAGKGLKILTPNQMLSRLPIYQDKDGEDVPKLVSIEVLLVHCNLVNNSYQQASKVLLSFVPNEQFGQLITISPHSLSMLKTTNKEFQSIQVWFTDQNNRPIEIEDSVNITLIIG